MAGLTAKEMEYEAKVIYEGLASANAPGYTSRQWSILLTQAQEKIVNETITEGWDKNEKNRRIIANLIASTETSAKINPYLMFPNAYRVPLPDKDYMHIISDVANGSVKVKPVEYDYVEANKNNPFEKPDNQEYWRLVDGKFVVIITDKTPLTKYRITYIKRPKPIVTASIPQPIEGVQDVNNCELDPIIHRRIVERAARLANAYTLNQTGYQLTALEEMNSK